MRSRTAVTSMVAIVRAASQPALIVPGAFVAVLAMLSPPAIDDASAQGFGMHGPRGGFSSGGPPRRFHPSMPRGMFKRPAIVPRPFGHRPRPNGDFAVAPGHPKGGMRGMGGGMRGMGGWRPNGDIATGHDHPKGGMRGMRGSRPNDTTVDTRYPRGHRPHRRWPRRPIYVPVPGDVVVAVPGGEPPSGPPSNIRRHKQPPSTPPARSRRRPSKAVQPANDRRRYVPNEVVVEVASGVSAQSMAALARRHRLTQLETVNLQITGTSIRRLRINGRRSVPAVVRALEADRTVMAAQPNYLATLQDAAAAAPVAPELEQYALARMRMPEAHALANGNRVLIAVIDAGADTKHPELAGIVVDTFDAIGTGDRAHRHGTAIVGAIAARAKLQGTAPAAHFLVARAFGTTRDSMDGTTVNIVKSIDWAMGRGARIINMSFAGGRDPAIARHLTLARERGIILVAAAGNAGPKSAPLYPAANPAVIAVTATDEGDRIFRLANRGNHIAVAAPGVDLWLPTVGTDYQMTSGTSFSAAEVTGVIALMLERNPNLTADAIRRALVTTARDLGPRGIDPQFGAGLVDAYQAVRSILPEAPETAAAPVTTGVGGGE